MGGKKQKGTPLGCGEAGGGGEIGELLVERGKTHGDFIVQAWIAQSLKAAAENGENWMSMSDDKRESIHMILHKVSRIVSGDPNFVDHWDDIQGYARLVSDKLRK